MSYGVRYRCTLTDTAGVLHKVELLKKGYVGSVTGLNLLRSGLSEELYRINQSARSRDKMPGVHAIKVELNVLKTITLDAFDFLTDDPFGWRLDIYRNFVLENRLWLQGNLIKDPVPVGRFFTLTFTDYLKELDAVKYLDEDGRVYDDLQKPAEMLWNCLKLTQMELPLATIDNVYGTGMSTGLGDDPLNQCYINPLALLDNNDEPVSCWKVLQALCSFRHAQLFQSEGMWVFRRLDEVASGTVRQRMYYGGLLLNGLTKDLSTRVQASDVRQSNDDKNVFLRLDQVSEAMPVARKVKYRVDYGPAINRLLSGRFNKPNAAYAADPVKGWKLSGDAAADVTVDAKNDVWGSNVLKIAGAGIEAEFDTVYVASVCGEPETLLGGLAFQGAIPVDTILYGKLKVSGLYLNQNVRGCKIAVALSDKNSYTESDLVWWLKDDGGWSDESEVIEFKNNYQISSTGLQFEANADFKKFELESADLPPSILTSGGFVWYATVYLFRGTDFETPQAGDKYVQYDNIRVEFVPSLLLGDAKGETYQLQQGIGVDWDQVNMPYGALRNPNYYSSVLALDKKTRITEWFRFGKSEQRPLGYLNALGVLNNHARPWVRVSGSVRGTVYQYGSVLKLFPSQFNGKQFMLVDWNTVASKAEARVVLDEVNSLDAGHKYSFYLMDSADKGRLVGKVESVCGELPDVGPFRIIEVLQNAIGTDNVNIWWVDENLNGPYSVVISDKNTGAEVLTETGIESSSVAAVLGQLFVTLPAGRYQITVFDSLLNQTCRTVDVANDGLLVETVTDSCTAPGGGLLVQVEINDPLRIQRQLYEVEVYQLYPKEPMYLGTVDFTGTDVAELTEVTDFGQAVVAVVKITWDGPPRVTMGIVTEIDSCSGVAGIYDVQYSVEYA